MKVLVTRPADKAVALCDLLAAAGLDPVCLPALETQPVEDMSALDGALARLADYRRIVFTSGTAARLFCQRAQVLGVPLDDMGARVVAGPATAETLADYGVHAATVLSPFSAERALEALAPLVRPGDQLLLPRPERSFEMLARGLRACGAAVDEVVLYRATPAGSGVGEVSDVLQYLAHGEIDAVTFFSPSAVRGLEAAMDGAGLRAGVAARLKAGATAACIGRTTAAVAEEAGWRRVVVPRETTSASLVAALTACLRPEVVAC